MSPKTAVAYQATDLARSHRQVIDAARSGRALIRDKDGLALLMIPAEDVERTSEVAELALDLVRAARSLLGDTSPTSAAGYGRLGWLSVLPIEARARFFAEMSEALLIAASGTTLHHVETLMGDWRATAESWADPGVRERLLADEVEPLADVLL